MWKHKDGSKAQKDQRPSGKNCRLNLVHGPVSLKLVLRHESSASDIMSKIRLLQVSWIRYNMVQHMLDKEWTISSSLLSPASSLLQVTDAFLSHLLCRLIPEFSRFIANYSKHCIYLNKQTHKQKINSSFSAIFKLGQVRIRIPWSQTKPIPIPVLFQPFYFAGRC